MGNFSSNYTYNTINSFTSMINSFSTRILNKASTECASIQSARFDFGTGTIDAPCTINTSVRNSNITTNIASDFTCGLSQDNLNKITVKFSSDLQTSISNWIKENTQQNNGWLATGINIAIQEGVTETDLSTMLANSISSDISNVCRASIVTNQSVIYRFCGTYDNLILDTNLTSKGLSLATCINRNIQTSVVNNKVLMDIINKTDQAVSQTNAGLFDFIIYIIVGIVIIAVIGAIASIFTGGGSDDSDYVTDDSSYSQYGTS